MVSIESVEGDSFIAAAMRLNQGTGKEFEPMGGEYFRMKTYQ